MGNGTIILRAADLHKSYIIDSAKSASLEVLRGIDLEVAKGEFVAIVGASGSGKSTLLHILGGLDRPTSGEVFWSGENIRSWSDDALAAARGKGVGFVFQFHHLLPEFTAAENVMIPMMIAGTAMRAARLRAEELLARVHVEHRSGHRPSELSGGEQQRVAVARALANRPAVVLADEPSGNLDSESSTHLHALLRELNRTEGQTFVIVTHNDRFAANADRVFVMGDGKCTTRTR
jgi:lipoprotein-releasing system ATP-binding protein